MWRPARAGRARLRHGDSVQPVSAPPEGTTGADGTVNLTMSQRSGFPVSKHQQLLVVFIRARKPGESITGGISTRLLVSFPVSLKK